MRDRRSFLKRLSSVPMLGGLFADTAGAAGAMKLDYFKELGIKPFINAAGTFTTLTASLMPREVMEAMDYVSRRFVRLNEVQDAVGERIAKLTGAEAAMVTSGAAGALTCGTAACITGKDAKAIQQLPDLTGLKSEVIVQKSHRYGYDHAVRACGVRVIEIDGETDFPRAVNNRTAMALFFNANEPMGNIKAEQWVALGKKHNVPTFNDAAADAPPVGTLSKFTRMGFDLVTFSGGKGIRGPQSAGLLLGRKDLIEAARLNTSPYSDTIARGMKVNKEEMVGMLVALELFMKRDHDADWREWERRIKIISDAVASLPSVKTETKVYEIANHVPHLHARWDQERLKIAPLEVMRQLRVGEPSIEAHPGTSNDELVIGVWMLQPGEAETVGRRVREILKSA